MAERRRLVEGLKSPPPSRVEEAFVYGEPPPPAAPQNPSRAARVALTTRIRSDLASALKRASLERELRGETPHTLQEILEEALAPWLQEHGFLG